MLTHAHVCARMLTYARDRAPPASLQQLEAQKFQAMKALVKEGAIANTHTRATDLLPRIQPLGKLVGIERGRYRQYPYRVTDLLPRIQPLGKLVIY
jgi:hypothetical protein